MTVFSSVWCKLAYVCRWRFATSTPLHFPRGLILVGCVELAAIEITPPSRSEPGPSRPVRSPVSAIHRLGPIVAVQRPRNAAAAIAR